MEWAPKAQNCVIRCYRLASRGRPSALLISRYVEDLFRIHAR